MKKIIIAAVLFVAAGLVTSKANAQVSVGVGIHVGIGTPAYPAYYAPPPPPRRVVVYDAPCPRPVVVAPSPVVVYRDPYPRRVVVRDRYCDYRDYREYRDDDRGYRGRGRKEGWYKHGRDGYYRD